MFAFMMEKRETLFLVFRKRYDEHQNFTTYSRTIHYQSR